MKSMIKHFLGFVLALAAAAGMALAAVMLVKGYGMYQDALLRESLTDKVAAVQAGENYVTADRLPATYLEAVVATEDHRFYRHGGIDVIGLARALWSNLRAGALEEGGSTITQQLAKNLYFMDEKSLVRKVAEAFMAFKLEKTYTKAQILELYVNCIYFGSGCYGVRAASLCYFGKEPGEMSADECTLLAGIPNAPSVYSPKENPDLAHDRQQYVERQMEKYAA